MDNNEKKKKKDSKGKEKLIRDGPSRVNPT